MKFDGRKLRETRLLKGLRQADVAELTRQQGQLVDSRTLSHWENNPDANPRPKNIAVVAKALGVAPDIFYTSEHKGPDQRSAVLSGGGSTGQPPHIHFWEALGYTVAQDAADGLILRSGGRKKNIFLSQADSERIYIHVKKYTDFVLSESLKI